ncbi:MAG TPA: hypothetical protein VGB02_12265 [Pyrinomonadaceae bacterium]|jgi:hypothetical protein
MKKVFSRFTLLITLAFFCLVSAQAVFACGVERWGVKVAQDKHVNYFFKDNSISTGKLQPFLPTTIAKLHQEDYPFEKLTGKPPKWSYTQRAGIAEFRIWTINAILTKKKNEADEDYHLVLKSGGKFLVAEIPSAQCVEDTVEPLKGMIIQARSDFDEWFSKQTKKTFNQKVRITGIGFFDRVHGAEGASPNGIELHPIIKIEFLQ